VTANDVLTAAQTAGIVLEARGDRLHVEAPRGTLTPKLRDALAQRKAELLAALDLERPVTLRGGVAVPLAALRLAWGMEARGFRITLNGGRLSVQPFEDLTSADRVAVTRWCRHLGALVRYCDEVAG